MALLCLELFARELQGPLQVALGGHAHTPQSPLWLTFLPFPLLVPVLVHFCALTGDLADADLPRALLRLLDALERVRAAATTPAAAAAAANSVVAATSAASVASLRPTLMEWAMEREPLAPLSTPPCPSHPPHRPAGAQQSWRRQQAGERRVTGPVGPLACVWFVLSRVAAVAARVTSESRRGRAQTVAVRM